MTEIDSMRLRVSNVMAPVHNLGPGRRIGVWVQGCPLHCPGCVSPETWDPAGGASVSVTELAGLCAQLDGEFDGVTISGGEPFEQYAALMAFVALVKRLRPWTALVYTGYTIEEIRARHRDGAFLSLLDGIVDGRYQARLPSNAPWRGSTNQRYFRMGNGAAEEVPNGFATGAWSVAVQDRVAWLAGIPAPGDLFAVGRTLREGGYGLRWSGQADSS